MFSHFRSSTDNFRSRHWHLIQKRQTFRVQLRKALHLSKMPAKAKFALPGKKYLVLPVMKSTAVQRKNGTYKKIKTISKNKTVSFVTKLPKKKGTYYFKVRTYRKAEGKVYYGKDSAVKSRK